MAIPPESPPPGAPYRMGVRQPTQLVREILDISKHFQAHVGRELTVNATDLAAMEFILIHGTMGPTELARRLGLSTAAVTSVVDRLVALGHVTREKHPTDRRAIVVEPTPASTVKAMSTIMPVVRAIESTLDGFDDDEQAVISRYLALVADAYRAELPAEAR
jgi:DNA-binding MarR family transcriptional regulator